MGDERSSYYKLYELYTPLVQSSKAKYSPRVKLFKFYQFGRTLVKSTESEFFDTGRPKQVKNPGEKLYAPLVQSSEAKYSLSVEIFKFYQSGRTPFESTESEFSALGQPKRVKNSGEKLYAPLVQSSEGKYSLQVKIFEFYPFGRTLFESTESEYSAIEWPKRVKNPGEKLYHRSYSN